MASSDLQAHLQLIQSVISRMAQNSFLLKGWTVVLVSGLFALAASNSDPAFAAVALVPITAFWYLDAYYLWQEKLFRRLYDEVRQMGNDVDFGLDTARFRLSRWADLRRVALSGTILGFYGTMMMMTAVVAVAAD